MTLLTVGGALWVALRDLHRDAALGALAELTVPYASQARQRFPPELLRPRRATATAHEDHAAFQESRQGQAATEAFDDLRPGGPGGDRGRGHLRAAHLRWQHRRPRPRHRRHRDARPDAALAAAPCPGSVHTGTTEIEGLGEVLYAATPIREPLVDRSVPTLVLARADDSARLATDDLVRALAVAALVLLAIGIPLALGLSRSVAAPLRRLAAASGPWPVAACPSRCP